MKILGFFILKNKCFIVRNDSFENQIKLENSLFGLGITVYAFLKNNAGLFDTGSINFIKYLPFNQRKILPVTVIDIEKKFNFKKLYIKLLLTQFNLTILLLR